MLLVGANFISFAFFFTIIFAHVVSCGQPKVYYKIVCSVIAMAMKNSLILHRLNDQLNASLIFAYCSFFFFWQHICILQLRSASSMSKEYGMRIVRKDLQEFLEVFICFGHQMLVIPFITVTLRTSCLVHCISSIHLLPPFFDRWMATLLSEPIIILKLHIRKIQMYQQ